MGFDHSTADINSGEMEISMKWETPDKPPVVTGEVSIAGFKLYALLDDEASNHAYLATSNHTCVIYLSVTYECSDDLTPCWSLNFEFKAKVKGSDRLITSEEGQHETLNGQKDAAIIYHCADGCKKHDRHEIFLNATQDFSITLQLTVVAKTTSNSSTFTDKNIAEGRFFANCKLVLQDDRNKELFVNKEHLATYSSFFKTLFFGEFREKDMASIPIKNVTLEEMLEFLWCLQLPPLPVDDWDMENNLKLADRFGCPHLMRQAESFFLETTSTDRMDMKKIMKHLLLLDLYRMDLAFKNVWKRHKKCWFRLLHPNNLDQLRPETRNMILVQMSQWKG